MGSSASRETTKNCSQGQEKETGTPNPNTHIHPSLSDITYWMLPGPGKQLNPSRPRRSHLYGRRTDLLSSWAEVALAGSTLIYRVLAGHPALCQVVEGEGWKIKEKKRRRNRHSCLKEPITLLKILPWLLIFLSIKSKPCIKIHIRLWDPALGPLSANIF